MAHSERLVARLRGLVEWIAPVAVYPGEDELRALAEGVFRVLDGEEEAKRMGKNREQGNEGTRDQGYGYKLEAKAKSEKPKANSKKSKAKGPKLKAKS
jgi:hypothetical protein